ncbi:MAG: hypothetical protein U5R06_16540 [candidate division KSB1 bacterium]|nr:hypothetical protein [candidate division KSB1 bacterium]
MKKLMVVLLVLVAGLLVFTVIKLEKVERAATSELSFQEKLILNNPVLDQETGRYGMIAIYEFRVTNDAGPAVTLESVNATDPASGFVVALKNEKVIGKDLDAGLFRVPFSVEEIKNDPAKLRESMKTGGTRIKINDSLEPGTTQTYRIGVSLFPYDKSKQTKANLVLISLTFDFDNLKRYTKRQGFPIIPLEQETTAQ